MLDGARGTSRRCRGGFAEQVAEDVEKGEVPTLLLKRSERWFLRWQKSRRERVLRQSQLRGVDHSTFPIRRVASRQAEKPTIGLLCLILRANGFHHQMLPPKIYRGGFAAAYRKIRSVQSIPASLLIVAESIATYKE
jgi:hypothetical protein